MFDCIPHGDAILLKVCHGFVTGLYFVYLYIAIYHISYAIFFISRKIVKKILDFSLFHITSMLDSNVYGFGESDIFRKMLTC